MTAESFTVDFDIPPTPSRLGAVQHSNAICELMFDEPDFLDDGSLSSLTGEVLEAQRCQMSELDTKREMLKKLEVELHRSQKIYQSIFNEVKTMTRQLYLLQENVDETKDNCSKIECDIVEILAEKRELKSHLVNTRWDGKGHLIYFEKYQHKMKIFRQSVEHYQEESEVNKEIKNIENEIEELNNKESGYQSINQDKDCTQLESENLELCKIQQTIEAETKALRQQVNKEKENLFILKKENEALQKRDASNVKRLKRQIMETERQNLDRKQQNNCLYERIRATRK